MNFVKVKFAKKYLHVLNKHFPKSANVHKGFDRTNEKTRPSCIGKMKSVINFH